MEALATIDRAEMYSISETSAVSRLDEHEREEGSSLLNYSNHRNQKSSRYDLESVDKLKEEGYNLFNDLIHTTTLDDILASRKPAMPSNKSYLKLDEQTMKSGKKTKFFKEFTNQHKASIATQLKAVQDAMGNQNLEAIQECKEYVYSTHTPKPVRNHH